MPIFNPGSEIIKAYLNGVKQRQSAKAESDRVQQQEDARTEAARQFDESHQLAKDQFDAETKMRQANGALTAMQIKQAILRSATETGQPVPGAQETQTPTSTTQQDQDQLNQFTGVNPNSPNQLKPGITPPSFMRNITLPGDTAPNQVPDQLTYARQQADVSSILQHPKVQAAIDEATGMNPILKQRAQDKADVELPNQLTLETAKSQDAAALKAQEATDANTRLDRTIASNQEVARIRGGFQLAAAKMKAANKSGLDPQAAANITTMVGAGQAPMPTDKDTRNVVMNSLSEKGWVVPDKTMSTKIDALGSLPTVFGQLRDFANKNLSESKGFGPLGTSLSSKIPQSEIANELDQLKLNAGPIAKIFEGSTGRYNILQLETAMNSMTSGKITKGEALKKVNGLETAMMSKIKNEVLGGMPDSQKASVLALHPEVGKVFKTFNDQKTGKPIFTISHDGGLSYEEVK